MHFIIKSWLTFKFIFFKNRKLWVFLFLKRRMDSTVCFSSLRKQTEKHSSAASGLLDSMVSPPPPSTPPPMPHVTSPHFPAWGEPTKGVIGRIKQPAISNTLGSILCQWCKQCAVDTYRRRRLIPILPVGTEWRDKAERAWSRVKEKEDV